MFSQDKWLGFIGSTGSGMFQMRVLGVLRFISCFGFRRTLFGVQVLFSVDSPNTNLHYTVQCYLPELKHQTGPLLVQLLRCFGN